MTITKFKAPWVVAFQGGEHRLLKDGCVVVEDDTVRYVGRHYPGPVDETVETRALVSPGFISTHSHLHESPLDKTLGEDSDRRQFWSTSLVDILPTKAAAMREQDMLACLDYSMIELIRTGTTTVLQLGELSDAVADRVDASGLRAYIGESYRSGRWLTRNGRNVEYEWDEPGGQRGLDRAVDFVRRQAGRGNGRIQGLLNPAQVDTCTEGLLRDSKAAAAELGVPLTIHAAQSVYEFHEMTRRHGRTPIEWLSDIGFLGENTLIAHCLFLAGNPWVNFAGDDLGLLADSGTAISYNAWVFARNGINMESYDKYRRAGVRISLGTDTVTQSMIESCRWTAVLGKIAERRSDGATARQVFDSATVIAADLLGRPDLGRIAPGAKADLLFWRTDSLFMTPMRDPIRSIVYYAQAEDLAHVMVDGNWIQRDGAPVRGNLPAAVAALSESAQHVWNAWPEHDWAGRTLDEQMGLSCAPFEDEPGVTG